MPPPSTDKHLERLAHALRRHRKANGQSLGALSRRTGLSKTSLMRLESGQANPSLETLWRVGHELGLTIAQLLEPPGPGDRRAVRPAGEGARVLSEAGMEGRLLHHDAGDHRTEVFELTLAAHVRFGADAHGPGTTELVYCLAGDIDCGPDDEPLTLHAGDSGHYDGDRSHHYAAGSDGGRALLVMSYPRGQ